MAESYNGKSSACRGPDCSAWHLAGVGFPAVLTAPLSVPAHAAWEAEPQNQLQQERGQLQTQRVHGLDRGPVTVVKGRVQSEEGAHHGPWKAQRHRGAHPSPASRACGRTGALALVPGPFLLARPTRGTELRWGVQGSSC